MNIKLIESLIKYVINNKEKYNYCTGLKLIQYHIISNLIV